MCMSFASVLRHFATEPWESTVGALPSSLLGSGGVGIRCTRNYVIRIGLALSSLSA